MTTINRSLRTGLLLRLSAVLLVLLTLDAIACYATALHFANLVYDRWLIDSAHSLAQAVRVNGERIELDMSSAGLRVFQFDEVDHTYFRVRSLHQGTIVGAADLPIVNQTGKPVVLTDALYGGVPVRLVVTSLKDAKSSDLVFVEIAETLVKRAMLTREIVLAMVAPQIALLAGALLLAWFGVSRGLQPLTDLAAQIESRGHDNLTPVSELGLPYEAQVLAVRINELLTRMEHAIGVQKRFVADAAHQLRTPLAAISLHAERAIRAAGPETEHAALQALRTSVERATRLSQQLLLLARAESGAVILSELKSIDVAALARSIGESWITQALQRDIDFGLVVPAYPVYVVGDAGLLSEMLSNLIDNALRYTQSGGRVTVSVKAHPISELIVEDNGLGIPNEERQKVLERFYRVPGTASEGCGLGLAIVKDIAELHGAVLTIASNDDGIGTRIAVRFSTCS